MSYTSRLDSVKALVLFREKLNKGRGGTPPPPPLRATVRACADSNLSPVEAEPPLSNRQAEDARQPGANARAQYRLPCPLRSPAALPATTIASFRPGKASWGLMILEVESPILATGKRLWKSWRAVLGAEDMGGPSCRCGTGDQ